MDDKPYFSQYYSRDIMRYQDKDIFRRRLLKYLHYFVNHNLPETIDQKCGAQLGLNIEKDESLKPTVMANYKDRYLVEKTFIEKPVAVILDFVGACYFALEPHQNDNPDLVDKLKKYIEEVNAIFREESMCYVLHPDGKVRYYPDDEFHELIKCTLICLNKPKYDKNLTTFNDALDDLYKNPNTESPINKLFKGVETLVLSILNDREFKKLDKNSTDKLMFIFTEKAKQDSAYIENDIEALSSFNDTFNGWVKMSHKYRHGKLMNQNINMPAPLFNLIFSMGVSIFRFLLEFDDKYHLIPLSGT